MLSKILGGRPYRIIYGSDNHPDPDEFPLHTHDCYEILIFLSGNVTCLVEGNRYTPHPYSVMVYNIAEAHTVIVDPSVPYERVGVYLDKNVFPWLEDRDRLLRLFYARPLGERNLIDPEAFSDSLWRKCLQRLMEAEDDGLEFIANLLPFLNELAKAAEKMPSTSLQDQLSRQLVNYINENISEPLTTAAIAKHFHISRNLLYTLFKQATGANPHEYIRAKRLVLARQLIMDGISPNEAYLKCGYKDYATFFRGYKARFGTSPKADHSK